MVILSQQDPRWAKITLGKSNYTVGRYGCTTTGISMASDYFKNYHNPGYMAQHLEYTDEGYILWQSLSEVELKLLDRFYGKRDEKIKEAIKNPKKVCILQVNNNHWVVATGVSIFGGYNIADPWYGDKSTTRRYKNNITGGAILTKY